MPMRPPVPGSRSRSRGFTLIELLVALSIMAVMAAMAWQGVDAVVRSREITQAHMERLLRLQSVMSQWEIDLREVHDSQVVPGLNFDGATLRLTRRRPEGLQVVAWTLRGGTLWRWSSPAVTAMDALQEHWMRSYQLLGSEAGTLAMLHGVSQWQLYHYHQSSSSWSNAQSSGDLAGSAPAAEPATTPGRQDGQSPDGGGAGAGAGSNNSATPPVIVNQEALPDGVRLLLQFGEGGTAAGTLTRDIRLIHP
ncbi:PulJ/GspJ family protein [Sphaerotilus sulfidivorans]